jgi:hypothetical protein
VLAELSAVADNWRPSWKTDQNQHIPLNAPKTEAQSSAPRGSLRRNGAGAADRRDLKGSVNSHGVPLLA